MLGRLARKLRLLGLDTEYHRGSDREFVKRSIKENRIPVTKDEVLTRRRAFKKAHLPVIFPDFNDYHKQVHYVINQLKKLEIYPEDRKTRCSVCNKELLKLNNSSAQGNVPAYVFKKQNVFFLCPKCLRIYWEGSHVSNYIEDLKKPSKENYERK